MLSHRKPSPLLPSRRSLLKAAGVGLIAATAPDLAFGAEQKGQRAAKGKAARAKSGKESANIKRISVGVQLYSVRKDVEKDFDGALKQIADMGFDGVEFAGYFKYASDPEGLRKLLDQLKLKVAGTHIPVKAFDAANLKQTIAFHKTIGCSFLIVPGDGRFSDPDKCQEYAKLMTDAAAALKADGLYCGHHNHQVEFKTIGDKTYWDLFAERTSKDVILQLDLGHAFGAGVDPLALLKKQAPRIRSTHLKGKVLPKETAGKRPVIGEDTLDWKAIIDGCYGSGFVDWMLVEQEEYPDGLSPMEATRKSLVNFKKLLADAGH